MIMWSISYSHMYESKVKRELFEKNTALAPRILPLAIVEKLVKESIGFKDVDDMYYKIRAFMMDEYK
jgi:hypothetical protein